MPSTFVSKKIKNMKRIILLLLFCSVVQTSFCQKIERIYRNTKDTTINVYDLMLPKIPIKGILALDYQSLSDSTYLLAYQQGIAILNVFPTANYLDMMLEDKPLTIWNEMLLEVSQKYHIPSNKVIVGGMSASAVGAIRYAQYKAQGKLAGNIKIAGIIAVDPPLDYDRFWRECNKKVKMNFHPAAVAEGKLLMKMFEDKLGGTPFQQPKAYQKASPFCYAAENGGNAQWLSHTPIRLYHEPDVNWWIKNRHQDYYGMNSIDCAALANQLLINGNEEATLIETNNKGFRPDGTRHPHSWTIVDEKELLKWCNDLFDRK
jgi:hypothetical protein